jgi:uncharacterized protein YcfJ
MKTKLKPLTKSLIVAGMIAGISLPAAANKYRDYNNSAYDYARVVNVEPVVETYQVNNPVEECWDEQVRHDTYYDDRRPKNRTADIIGTIIGGAIGNRFGHGDGRKIATVAGAVLGRSVGRNVRRNNEYRNRDHRDASYTYETVKRCELRDSYTTKEHIIGYDVSYKYRGNVFQTQMSNQPGDKIKVKVTVDPV